MPQPLARRLCNPEKHKNTRAENHPAGCICIYNIWLSHVFLKPRSIHRANSLRSMQAIFGSRRTELHLSKQHGVLFGKTGSGCLRPKHPVIQSIIIHVYIYIYNCIDVYIYICYPPPEESTGYGCAQMTDVMQSIWFDQVVKLWRNNEEDKVLHLVVAYCRWNTLFGVASCKAWGLSRNQVTTDGTQCLVL